MIGSFPIKVLIVDSSSKCCNKEMIINCVDELPRGGVAFIVLETNINETT